MKKNSTLVSVASKLWPVGHRRFEEMCTLAVTAQLGGAQMCELDEHVATCSSCREFLETLAQVSVQAMPLIADKRVTATKPVAPAGMRDRFLARLASEELPSRVGIHQRANSTLMNPYPLADNGRSSAESGNKKRPEANSKPLFSVQWRLLAAGATLMIAIGAYYIGQWKGQRGDRHLMQFTVRSAPTHDLSLPVADPNRVIELERQRSELQSEVANLRQELLRTANEREDLRRELSTTRDKLATLIAQVPNRSQPVPPATAQVSDQISTLQAELVTLRQRMADSDVKAAIEKQTSDELAKRLEYAEVDLQRERDLKSARGELGDLVAARNLHIVDVYDADPNGKRQRSFGRVFYIEGKSLVFYAYDLEDPRKLNANVIFHVWGGKTGLKTTTHKLGILHKDDTSENRWAMTFDDPNVLAQINSVFVTAESANKRYDEPHGKKILYAYFGSPANHP